MSQYKYFVKSFFSLSTRYSKLFDRFPLIYFLPIFHINRLHYSENFSSFCFSYKSATKAIIFSLAMLPLKAAYILINSIYFCFAFRPPKFANKNSKRLFLSHLVPSTDTNLKHVFRGIPNSDSDLHLVTSSLYERDQFFCQYFVANNNHTIYCRSYAPPFMEFFNIFYSSLLVPLLIINFFTSNTYVQKLFFLNAINQLVSLQSLIPLRLVYNLRWLSKAINIQISEVFISYEGYAWEHAVMHYFSQSNISVNLYCHAPITPNNLSCFRNSLPSFRPNTVFVPNGQTLQLFLNHFSQNFYLPSIRTFPLPVFLTPPNKKSLVSTYSLSLRQSDKNILLLPENFLSEVLLFLRFIASADSCYSFVLRLHPRTSEKDKKYIQFFIRRFLSHLLINISTSTLDHDSNLAYITLYRASSAIIRPLINSNTIPVFINVPDKPCPNPLYYLDPSLFLSCESFSEMTSIPFVRPSTYYYYNLLS